MSSGYEKLGIEIDFQFAKGLAEVVDKIEAAFKNIKIADSLSGEERKINTLAKKMADALGEPVSVLKKELKDANYTKAIADGQKLLNQNAKGWDVINGKIVNTLAHEKEQLAEAKKLNIEKQKLLRLLTEAHNINKQNDWNKQAGTIGQNYASFGNGFVRSSALTFDPNNTVEMNKAHAAAAKLNSQFQTGTKSINAFTASFGRMTTRLAEFYSIRTVMFAVSGQVREAIAATLDFNQALHDTAAIAGSSVDEMKQFEKLAVSIATSSRFSLAQTTEIMKTLAQAGIKANDMPDMTKATALFATGAGATPAQAVDLMTTSLNAYELKAQDGMRVSNALTAALNASKLEAGGLGTAFNYLANQSEMMGFELEETLGIIAAFSNRGVKSSTIGTGVSSLLVDLAAPKPRFAALMKEYKVGLAEINPMTHTFSEIIARLEKAAIPVDRILASMDKRIGKALVTALNIGADGFDLMTKAVTGTDAALVANYKAMQGARAQLNVLKSEFTIAIKEIGDSLSGPITSGFKAVKTVVAGLRTDGGMLVLTLSGLTIAASAATGMFISLSKAIATAGTAAALFTKLNGWVLVLTSVFATAAAALTYFGKEQAELTEKSEAYSKKLAENADKTQQAELGLLDIYTQVDKKQIDAKTGYIKFTNNQKEALIRLKNEYSGHFDNLDIEFTKMSDLKGILEEIDKLQSNRIKSSVDTFNMESHRNTDRRLLLEMEPGYKRVESILNKSGTEGRNTIEKLINTKSVMASNIAGVNVGVGTPDEIFLTVFKKRNKDLLAAYQESKKLQEVSKQMFDGTAVIDTKEVGGEYFAKILEKTEESKKSNLTSTTKTHATEKEKDELKNALDDIVQYRSKLQEERDKDIENILTKSFNDEELSIEKKTENLYEAWNKIEEQSIKETARKKSELRQKFNKYDEETKKNPLLVNQFKLAEEDLDKSASSDLDKSLQALTDKFQAGTKLKLPVLSADIVDKQQDKRIRNAQQSNAIAKDAAKTAEQVHALELDQLRLEIDANNSKKQAFKTAVDTLQTTIDATAESDRHGDNWEKLVSLQESYKDRLEETVLLTEELTHKLSSESNTSFWFNFEKGVTNATKSLGTFKSHTIDLGSQITGTLADGLTSTIDNMITSLVEGENAWKSFRDGIASVFSDIGKVLQKYVAELIAVWMVQQLVGIVTSSGGGGGGFGGGYGNGGNVNFGPGMADGGLVTGGIKGKDSVNALLMPKEYVIKAQAVEKYGVEFMHDLNQGKIKKFAEGGSVGGFSGGSSSQYSKGQEVGLTIINVADPNSVPAKTNNAEIMNVVSFAIDRRDPVIKKLKAFIKEA